MKIAIDARSMGSRPSGVGMYLNDFLRQLMKYNEFEFVLISDVAESENIKYFMNEGIKVRTWGKHFYKSVGVYNYFKFVQKVLTEMKPDVFWEVNTLIPIRLNGSFKTMITIHDMFPINYVEYFGRVYSTYFRYSLYKTLKKTDMILYNSEQTKYTTEEIFKNAANIPNCNAYIISNPLTEEWNITDKDYLLYVGNMEKRKGVDLLIKAYLRYRELGGRKKLVLAGKMLEQDIEELLNEAKSRTEDIIYLSYVNNNKKYELYSGCSCFVFPSKAEGFGMPVLEVMKLRKPILVSNLDIFDEIVGDCINRFDLKCGEAQRIENLANAMISYNPCVDEGKYAKAVARYSPDVLGETVMEFILKEVRGEAYGGN